MQRDRRLHTVTFLIPFQLAKWLDDKLRLSLLVPIGMRHASVAQQRQELRCSPHRDRGGVAAPAPRGAGGILV